MLPGLLLLLRRVAASLTFDYVHSSTAPTAAETAKAIVEEPAPLKTTSGKKQVRLEEAKALRPRTSLGAGHINGCFVARMPITILELQGERALSLLGYS